MLLFTHEVGQTIRVGSLKLIAVTWLWADYIRESLILVT